MREFVDRFFTGIHIPVIVMFVPLVLGVSLAMTGCGGGEGGGGPDLVVGNPRGPFPVGIGLSVRFPEVSEEHPQQSYTAQFALYGSDGQSLIQEFRAITGSSGGWVDTSWSPPDIRDRGYVIVGTMRDQAGGVIAEVPLGFSVNERGETNPRDLRIVLEVR